MNIGIDFDDTITADRELFHVFIDLAVMKGHDVRIVTARSEEYGVQPVFDYADTFAPSLPVIYTSGYEKAPFCEKYHDFKVDVWIDDNPHWCGTKDSPDSEWSSRPLD